MPQPGERVLELACGPGSVGLAAAGRVAPGGEVVLSDVAAEMTSIAAARAEALGLSNVSTRELDLESIEQPDSSYDVVLCREGLMLVPDPASAAREIRRVLRPGGRVAIAVWGLRERNPWLGVVFDAVSAQTGKPVPPPGISGPFSLDDPHKLADLLSSAGCQAWLSASYRHPCEPAPSRSGGRGRPPSPGRSRRCSRRCPRMQHRHFELAYESDPPLRNPERTGIPRRHAARRSSSHITPTRTGARHRPLTLFSAPLAGASIQALVLTESHAPVKHDLGGVRSRPPVSVPPLRICHNPTSGSPIGEGP